MNIPTSVDQPYDMTVRTFSLDVETIPTHWFDGSALLTHAANAQNLFFPGAERFCVRSVSRHRAKLADPALRDAVKVFVAQEAHHGNSTESTHELLRAQGFQIDGWLSAYQWCIETFERVAPAWLCLSVTAAMEHFTACVAECWLTEGKMPLAHPNMAAMLGWHAAEEIEHKAVAFDVLQAVRPGWASRMLGLGLVILFLLMALVSATTMLLWQDPTVGWARLQRERADAAKDNIRATGFIERHVGPYLAFDFHPNDRDNLHIAQAYLAQISGQFKVRA